jgi:hypothetical protein
MSQYDVPAFPKFVPTEERVERLLKLRNLAKARGAHRLADLADEEAYYTEMVVEIKRKHGLPV